MRVIRKEFFGFTRSRTMRIVPLGDTHVGPAACDEALLERWVENILSDPDARVIGMGDYCDWINRRDPRFSPSELADWFSVKDLVDLARAQRDRFLDIMRPLAMDNRFLALVQGNHETAIERHSERDVYSEIVTAIKQWQKMGDDQPLGLGYEGWLQLVYYRSEDTRERSHIIDINCHHGHGGGRRDGSKFNTMQDRMGSYDADLFLMGHTHIRGVQPPQVTTSLDTAGNITTRTKYGAHTGSFLRSYTEHGDTYASVKGYKPVALGPVEVLIRPGAEYPSPQIQIIS